MKDDVLSLDSTSAWVTLLVGGALLLAQFVIAITSLVIVPRNRKPQTALAWLLLIYILPLVGFGLFLLFGSRTLPKRRREKQQQISDYILHTTEGVDRVRRDHPWPPWLEPIV